MGRKRQELADLGGLHEHVGEGRRAVGPGLALVHRVRRLVVARAPSPVTIFH